MNKKDLFYRSVINDLLVIISSLCRKLSVENLEITEEQKEERNFCCSEESTEDAIACCILEICFSSGKRCFALFSD